MPRIPRQLSAKQQRQFSQIAVFIGVVVIFLLMLAFGAPSDAIHSVQQRFFTASDWVRGVYSRTFAKRYELAQENQELQAALQKITVDYAALSAANAEIKELEDQLRYQESQTANIVPARILARNQFGEHTLLIDKGSEDGIKPNRAAVVGDGVLVGTTTQVEPHASVVRLLADPKSNIPSAVLGSDRTIGLVQGVDGFILTMQFIPQDAFMKEGDIVATSGLDGALPPDLGIGRVTTIIEDETAPFKEALIEPLIDPESFRRVLIVDPTAPYDA